MPDIRQTALVDDFDRPAPENPALPPWVRDFGGWIDCQISGGTLSGIDFPPTGAQMYYEDLLIHAAGPPIVETWGLAVGSPALSDAWRFGLLTAGVEPDGYLMVMGQGVSGNFWDLRRYDDGQVTSIASAGGTLPGANYCLLRIVGAQVEVWMDDGTGLNWTLIASATDSTHRGAFFMHYGATGLNTGWGEVGGGPVVKSQIYRYVSN